MKASFSVLGLALLVVLGDAGCRSGPGERVERARRLTASGPPADAVEAWNAVLASLEHVRGGEARSLRVEALGQLGDLLSLQLGDPRGAAAAYRQVIALAPGAEPAWHARERLADIAERHLGDLPEAIAQRKALAASGRPGADGFAYQAARSYFAAGEFEQSRKDCRSLVARWPQGEWVDDALLLVAASFQFEGRHAEAVAAADDVVARFPGSEAAARARVAASRSLAALGRHEDALARLLEALPEHPDPREVQAEIAKERAALAKLREATPEPYLTR